MTIRELIKKLKDHKIDLSLDGDDLEINFDGDELPEDLLEEIRNNKVGIIDFLKQVYGLVDNETDQVIPLVPEQESYEMSPTQRRSWLVSQFSDSDIAYNMPMTFVLQGKLDVESLNYALKQQPLRHESLRTAFRADEHGEIRQFILKPEEVDFTIREIDLRQHPDKMEEAKRLVKKEMSTSIDLASGVLMRAVLIQLEDDQWTFHLTAHHIITDSWAMNMMIAELFLYYNIHNAGKGTPLPPLRIQQKDYVAWKLSRLKGENIQKHKDYWIKEFTGDIPVLNLPNDKPRPPIKTFHGEAISKYFSPQVTKKLKTVCQEQGATLFMGIMAGLNTLFYKYANQEDILMGIPVAGRDNPELHNQMGFFAFTLVIRTQFSGNDNFKQLLGNVKQKVLNAYEHQEFPFDDLVEELDLKRAMDRSLLFDTFVVMQMAGDMVSAGTKEEQMADDLAVFQFPDEDKPYTAFDMSINFAEMGDQLFVRLEYNCDIYKRATAIRMMDHLGLIFEAFISNPEKSLKDLDILSPEEKNQILVDFNPERKVQTVKLAGEKTVLDVLDEQLQKSASNPAVIFEGNTLTYDELNEKANQLGGLIKKNFNIHANETIAVKLERSEWMLVTLLAVLKSGAACLPIEADTPVERINQVVTASACKMLIDDNVLEQLKQEMEKFSKTNLPPLNRASDAAFVIFSTGDKPKMHQISHKNIIDYYTRLTPPPFVKDQPIITAFASHTFELSAVEMIGALTLGAKVVVNHTASHEAVVVNNELKPMDFSLFYFGNIGNEKNRYEILINAAKYGDKNGYTAIWTPERHFHVFGGPYPSPAIFGGAVAAVTDRIGIRAGSVVIPLNDPIRVAEDWSVVDNLSGGGRVSIACATGWNVNDFALAPDNYHTRHSIMYKRLEEIQNLWKGGKIAVKDGNGFAKELEIFPKPIQPSLPFFITTAGNVETYITAGRLGHGILSNMITTTPKELTGKVAAYRKALRDNGYDPTQFQMVMMLHVYIADTVEEAYAKAKKPFMEYLGNSVDLAKSAIIGTPHDMDSSDFSEQDMEDMLEFSFRRYVTNSALIGTKETCLKVLREMAKMGIDEIACLVDFGIDYESTMVSLEKLTELKAEYNAMIEKEAAEKGVPAKAMVISTGVASLEDQLAQFMKIAKEQANIEAAKADKAGKTQKTLAEGTAHKDSITKTITALFEEQVAKKGDTKILSFDEEAYSYKELNASANQLAAYLHKKQKLQPNDLVAIKLDRSEWMVIAILAVLKAGAAYVPIDPSYPQERINYILSDSGCKTVINDALLTAFRDEQDSLPATNPAPASGPSDLAYVIYTSGSTGKPKGVMIEHRNVVSFLDNMQTRFSLKPDLVMGATTNYTFDISVLELLGTLLTGVKTLLMDKAEPDEILEQVDSYKITALQITPSRLTQILNANENSIGILKKLKVLLVGGEALRHTDYDRLKELKATKVYNVYGPTETTIWSTCLDIQTSTALSIGKPLSNEGVYILNDEGALSPIGVPGEICIGGDRLARGYLNNPELTAEKFVADPFMAGEKIYKTGDLGRWLPDGNIEFRGRKDNQLKIQGYRIEPGEIENALKQYPQIEEAVVLAQLDKQGEKEMVAYLVCKGELNTMGIREHLRKSLPSYMMPAHYVQIDAVPLLPSGKADAAKLQEMAGLAIALGTEYVAPRNEIEEKIAAMWQDVLTKEKIGIKDDFFSLGGHSLKATKLIGMMLKEFGITMSLLTFFNNATVEGIAGEVEKTKWAANELFDIDNAEKVSI